MSAPSSGCGNGSFAEKAVLRSKASRKFRAASVEFSTVTATDGPMKSSRDGTAGTGPSRHSPSGSSRCLSLPAMGLAGFGLHCMWGRTEWTSRLYKNLKRHCLPGHRSGWSATADTARSRVRHPTRPTSRSSPDVEKPVPPPKSELGQTVAFNFPSEANCWVVRCQIEANQILSPLS